MNRLFRTRFEIVAAFSLMLLFCSGQILSAQDAPGAASSDYDQLVVTANSLLKDGRLEDAKQAVQQAIKAQPANYLAYAIQAKIASLQGNAAKAKELIDTAITLAPDDAKDKVRQLAAMLHPQTAAQSASDTPPKAEQTAPQIPPVDPNALQDAEAAVTVAFVQHGKFERIEKNKNAWDSRGYSQYRSQYEQRVALNGSRATIIRTQHDAEDQDLDGQVHSWNSFGYYTNKYDFELTDIDPGSFKVSEKEYEPRSFDVLSITPSTHYQVEFDSGAKSALRSQNSSGFKLGTQKVDIDPPYQTNSAILSDIRSQQDAQAMANALIHLIQLRRQIPPEETAGNSTR